MQGGLDGRPGVSNSCRWVVRVIIKVFDEFSGVVSWSSVVSQNEWGQIDAGVSAELTLFFAFGHATWAAAASRQEGNIGRVGGDSGRINIVCAAM